MSLSAAVLLSAMSLLATGDIYRCRTAGGAVSFQDKPCAGGASARLATRGEDSTKSLSALQRWLDVQDPRPARGPKSSSPPQSARVRVPLVPGGPVSEAQLAGCSERFLHCASGNAVTMDACVERLPRCSATGSGPCCPQACISRYQSLRGDGHKLSSAVRMALLDPQAPACSVANPVR